MESRRSDDMARLIERHGGVPFVSPSMREVPLEENPAAIDFAHRLITGQVDVVIFMTGVGFRHLLAQVERSVPRDRFLDALSDIATVARGPKPVAAMKEVNLSPTLRVPEPNTWRDVLTLLDAQLPLANLNVVVQEYGEPNPSLVAGLEARGARVSTVKVYDWDLPEDIEPLAANVRAITSAEIDVVLFTSRQQIDHLFKAAEALDMADQLRHAFECIAVASVGPTTSQRLRELELPVDIAPEHPKMGPLVAAAATRARQVLHRKQKISLHIRDAADAEHIESGGPWDDGPFMKACRREPTDVTPVWLMRQAGRYMAEYREVRAKTTFLELCKNPQLCSEVMCTAVERLGVDAAIIFSDLLPILQPMGLELEFAQGEGPVIHNPVREQADVDRVLELQSADSLHYVMETVRQTRADLPDTIPLIGFAGAPFTLASYAIEGGASRNYLYTKTLMCRDEGAWDALMSRLARAIGKYLVAQIAAGAQVVQIFDSWVGCLSVEDYRRFVLPYSRAVITALPPDVPVIHFATGNPMLTPAIADAGGSVIGLDWRIRLEEGWKMAGQDRAVQGNLDPMVLLADHDEIARRAQDILDQAAGRPGHIFNLGHGVLKQTPVESAIALVDAVHELSAK